MNSILKIWNKFPKFLRWILLFPIEFVVVVIIGIIIRILILSGGLPIQIFNLIFPPLMAIVGLFLIYHLAPSGKLILMIVLIILRALLIPVFIVAFIFHFCGANINLSWKEWWSPFIGEILTLIASVWLYKYLKEQHIRVTIISVNK